MSSELRPAAAQDAAPTATRGPSSEDTISGVGLRSLVIGSMPLLVAALDSSDEVQRVRAALEEGELARLEGFLGVDLPKGAKVGFAVVGDELRLVDDRDETLLRAPRSGFDPAWLSLAIDKKGTLFVAAQGIDPSPHVPARELAQRLDEAARRGDVLGAIVGVVEESPSLPLLFG